MSRNKCVVCDEPIDNFYYTFKVIDKEGTPIGEVHAKCCKGYIKNEKRIRSKW